MSTLEEAIALWRAGRRAQAQQLCEQLSAQPEADTEVWSLLAEMYSAGGDSSAAGRALQALLHIRPDDAAAWRQLGNVQLSLGDAVAAVASYQSALQLEPHNARCHNNLGQAWMRQRHWSAARQCFEQALALQPDYAIAYNNLGTVLTELGDHAAAIDGYQRAVRLNPAFAEAHHNLGAVLHQAGQDEQALVHYEQAVVLQPGRLETLVQRGNVLHRLGRFDLAVASYQAALHQRADHVEALSNCASSLLALGRASQALECCDRALQLRPDFPAAIAQRDRARWLLASQPADGLPRAVAPAVAELVNRAVEHMQRGQATQALPLFEQAHRLDPSCIEALVGCTSALLRLGRNLEALKTSERTVTLRPDLPEVHANFAAVLLALTRASEARLACEHALSLRPDMVEAHFNHGEALRALHELELAQAAYERALSLRPTYLPALCGLAQNLSEMGDNEGAAAAYRRALEVEPNHAPARFGLLFATIPVVSDRWLDMDEVRRLFDAELGRLEKWLAETPTVPEFNTIGVAQPFYLAYQERNNVEFLSRYGRLCVQLMRPYAMSQALTTPRTESPGSDGRVHLGIVTAYARDHSVYHALLRGWIERLPREQIRISVFHLGGARDATTLEAQRHVEFVECAGLSFGQCVSRIGSQQLDVLLYPEIGMDPTTVQLASMRLAPVQIVAWGHPESSGLPTLDHYLSAEAFEPPQAQSHYSEQLCALPNLGCYYEPFDVKPSAIDLGALGLDGSRPILLCTGTPYKYAPEYDEVLVELARRLPNCQLVFFRSPVLSLGERLLSRLRAAWRAAGLDPQRNLRTIAWQPREEFFGLMSRADLYLDGLGFSGFNSVMQALECELPVVAYEGRFMRGRFASGILRQLGLTELIATDREQFVQQVVRLSQDDSLKQMLRERLRSQVPQLYRDQSAIDGLAQFLLKTARSTPEKRSIA